MTTTKRDELSCLFDENEVDIIMVELDLAKAELDGEVERLRAALRAIIAEITDDAHEDSEDSDEMIESLMKIHELAKAGLRTTSDPPVKP